MMEQPTSSRNAILPYASGHRPPMAPPLERWERAVTWVLCLLPATFVVPPIGMYFAAHRFLGHWPQPWIDEPNRLPVEPFYSLAPMTCAAFPILLVATPAWLFVYQRQFRQLWLPAVLLLSLMAGTLAFWMGDFGKWYMD